jgi:hypothetical protein
VHHCRALGGNAFCRLCFHFVSTHECGHPVARSVASLRHCMRVGRQRDVHVDMAECLRDGDHINAGGEQVARERVAQIVIADLTDASSAQRG